MYTIYHSYGKSLRNMTYLSYLCARNVIIARPEEYAFSKTRLALCVQAAAWKRACTAAIVGALYQARCMLGDRAAACLF